MSTPITDQEEAAQAYIAQSRLLKHVAAIEPRMLQGWIEETFLCEFASNRWQDYERLKKQAQTFVGRDAPDARLRDPSYYTVMLSFLDWLLPVFSDPETEEVPIWASSDRIVEATTPRVLPRLTHRQENMRQLRQRRTYSDEEW